MKKKIGFILVLMSLIFEILIALTFNLPIIFRGLYFVGILELLQSTNIYVVFTFFKIIFIIGVYLLLKHKSVKKQLGIIILLLIIMPQILTWNLGIQLVSSKISVMLWNMSGMIGFVLLKYFNKQIKYFVIAAEQLLLVLIGIIFQTGFFNELINIYAVTNAFLPIVILITFILGDKLFYRANYQNINGRSMKFMNVQMLKRISIVLVISVSLIVVQSVFRTENHEAIYELKRTPEYERYPNEKLQLNVNVSPILFNLYYIRGELSIGEDKFKLNNLEKMKRFGDQKNLVHFNMQINAQNDKESMVVYIDTFGEKDTLIFRDILINLFPESFVGGERHQESYSYEIKK